MNSHYPESKSPFFARNYGGYSVEQKDYYESHLAKLPSQIDIFDPMGGQGYFLSDQVYRGNNVFLGDLNPAVLCLAFLRDPKVIADRRMYYDYSIEVINSIKEKQRNQEIISDDWISPFAKQSLEGLKKELEMNEKNKPQTLFNSYDKQKLFVMCIAILSARQIVSYTTSDNKTWLKPGGIVKQSSLKSSLIESLNDWVSFAEKKENLQMSAGIKTGNLIVSNLNIEENEVNEIPHPECIITSPPYANRLDYSRIWYPELAVFSEFCDFDIKILKDKLLGSTVVKDKNLRIEDESELLHDEVKAALDEIKVDAKNRSSLTYYYPFFLRYTLSLQKTFCNIAGVLKRNGSLVVFVRDTLRKDTLFPTGELIKSTLLNKGFILEEHRKIIIKNHVGLLRKNAMNSGIHGIAQQEWWFVFRKGK